MKKIKVFHLITELERGGAEILLLDFVRYLDKDKFEIVVGYLRGKGTLAEEFKRQKIQPVFFDIRSRLDLAFVLKLTKFIKDEVFDIVHTHLIDADIYGYLAAKLANVPVIISTKHNTDDFRKKRSPALFLDSFVANHLSKNIAVSYAVRNFLVKYQDIKTEKIEVIHNGIEIKKFSCDTEKKQAKIDLNLKANDYIIGTVARFDEQKGHKYLIEAIPEVLKEVNNVHFIFVGDGPLEQAMQKKAESLKIKDYVTFLGLRDDIPKILNALDIFVLPSLWEGLGISLLEAQAVGIPIIATDVDGIKEAVQNGKTGVLIPPANAETMAIAIIDLLQNKNKLVSFGLNARIFAEQNFSIELMAKNIELLYNNLLK